MILSDAISLNTSMNIAGRISLHLPGLWECSIFEVVCWRKTVRREENKRGKSGYCNIIPTKNTECILCNNISINIYIHSDE